MGSSSIAGAIFGGLNTRKMQMATDIADDGTLRTNRDVCRAGPGARFTKYLTTLLRLSYDNAKVTIDLRRTSNLQNILRRTHGFS